MTPLCETMPIVLTVNGSDARCEREADDDYVAASTGQYRR
jgi:hypothetical protein